MESVGPYAQQLPTHASSATGARQALAAMLESAAAGKFPAADGSVVVLPQPSERDAGVISLTGFAVIFADADREWVTGAVAARRPVRSAERELPPRTRRAPRPEDAQHRHADLRRPPRRTAGAGTRPDRAVSQRRIGGIRGSPGRCSTATMCAPGKRRAALCCSAAASPAATRSPSRSTRRTAEAALAPALRKLRGTSSRTAARLWAQIAPANAASVRAFLAAGFRPIGAEALLSRDLPE